MSRDRAHVRLSKRLSLVLRHDPGSVGLTLGDGGWVDVEDLLVALRRSGTRVDRDTLDEVVRTSDKQRFAYDDSGSRIRAQQGHSVPVDLGLVPTTPPDVLWHGTVARFLASIARDGLRPGARHHVHLSRDERTAGVVGARRGEPVLLRVDAAAMAAHGHLFWVSGNGVWLTDTVPPAYLQLDGLPLTSGRPGHHEG